MNTNEQQPDAMMVYDWSSQETSCRRMIVDDGKTQDEVLAALRTVGFTPSKRAFQNQVSKWNFPTHRTPALKNLTLIKVVKELWEQHILPAEMLRVLNQEKGFVVKEKELNNLRHSLGFYFRAPNTRKGHRAIAGSLDNADEDDGEVDEVAGEGNSATFDDDQDNAGDTITTTAMLQRDESYQSDEMRDFLTAVDRPRRRNPVSLPTSLAEPLSTSRHCKRKRADSSSLHRSPAFQSRAPAYPTPLPADVAARRAVKDEADAARAASVAVRHQRRHRHRQTLAGRDGSKASPRFPSEMTLDEAKAVLNLEQDTYRAVRDSFEEICKVEKIVRKKGSDNWQTAKDNLVASSPALYALFTVMATPAPNAFPGAAATVPTDQQVQALDILCMDVTKQMRNKSVRMSVTEAKKMLGLDPAKVTIARIALTERLIANNFVSKTESGEHWKVMRDEWIAEQRLKTDVNSMKAADVLCADVMKRINDNRTKQRRLDHMEVKEQSPSADGKGEEEEEHAKGTTKEEEHARGTVGENQGDLEPPYISQPVPASTALSHLSSPGGYVSLPMTLSATTTFPVAPTAAHCPALSSATVPQQTTHTYAPYAAPAESFQNLYPEIDPEILAMHAYERRA
ncbi:hypothetical protein MMC18_004738 [Xylographa bjoerkii]|nr:hypothetical protein [Xylographa bjoerkii]